MKKTISTIVFICISIVLTSCAGTKISNAYKSDNFATIAGKKVLVVSRTPQKAIREKYEKEISRALKAKGFDASPSHVVFPDLAPLTNKTVKRIEQTVAMFRAQGFDVLVLTALKDVQEQEVLQRQEGFGTLLDYYGNKYITLKGYYDDYNAAPKLPPMALQKERVTQKVVTFILEAVTYNLSLEEDQRLISVVTTEISNPSSSTAVKKGFAKHIANELE